MKYHSSVLDDLAIVPSSHRFLVLWQNLSHNCIDFAGFEIGVPIGVVVPMLLAVIFVGVVVFSYIKM